MSIGLCMLIEINVLYLENITFTNIYIRKMVFFTNILDIIVINFIVNLEI